MEKLDPVVSKAKRGELFGVFDGIGSAEKVREAAQDMATILEYLYSHRHTQTKIEK